MGSSWPFSPWPYQNVNPTFLNASRAAHKCPQPATTSLASAQFQATWVIPTGAYHSRGSALAWNLLSVLQSHGTELPIPISTEETPLRPINRPQPLPPQILQALLVATLLSNPFCFFSIFCKVVLLGAVFYHRLEELLFPTSEVLGVHCLQCLWPVCLQLEPYPRGRQHFLMLK